MKKLILVVLFLCAASWLLAAEVNKKWTAPANDDALVATGPVDAYDLRYSTTPITPENFEQAIQLPTGEPKAPGEVEQYTFDLPADAHYYFAIKSIDHAGNVSLISNTVEQDFFAPGAISDLE